MEKNFFRSIRKTTSGSLIFLILFSLLVPFQSAFAAAPTVVITDDEAGTANIAG
jgi:hypothetical protein